MSQAFIIMQIGDRALDRMCEEAILPAVRTCGLEPKRVDKHNEGQLLKSEIIRFTQEAEIIVADLTNERPNCYLEVGYAMGVGKFRNLVLTAREDHSADSPNHQRGGPKIHFDLSGYDILFWDPSNLDRFRDELEKRIRRRQRAIASSTAGREEAPTWDEEWLLAQRSGSQAGLEKVGWKTFMEVRFALEPPKIQVEPKALLDAARASVIHTFGWPFGVVLDQGDSRPRPRVDEIVAEIAAQDRGSYDYWALRRNGDYFLLKTLFEDMRAEGKVYFNTRVVRTAEVLLFCARLYTHLGVPPDVGVRVGIRYVGLHGRELTATASREIDTRTTTEDKVDAEVRSRRGDIERNLVDLVKELTAPLFVVFDFFVLSDAVYTDIVDNFVQGRIT